MDAVDPATPAPGSLAPARHDGPRALPYLFFSLVLLLAFALFAWGISWGLPSRDGWAGDEIVPRAVHAAARHGFAGGWHTTKYPPFHYMLLAAVHAPVRALAGADAPEPALNHLQMLASRWLSVAMALGAVWLVYRAAREVTGRGGAVLAALAVALVPTFVYFAKTANPEMPMLFWLALALWLYLRVRRRHRLRDWLLLAVAAALAVGTKDQAYGFFVLAPVALLPSLAARRRAEGRTGGLRTLADRRFLLALLAGVVAFALAFNLPANRQGFRAHLRTLTGTGSLVDEAREHPPTAAGHLANLGQNVRHLAFCLGAPLFALCLAGIAAAAQRRDARDRRLLALLLLGLSYYLTFLAPILFSRDRYTLPLVLVLAPCAGALLDRLLAAARGAARPLLAAALLAAFGWSALRALSIDRRMVNDSRYQVEAWVAAQGVPPKTAIAIGRPRHVPRIDRMDWRRLRKRGGAILTRWSPDYVVVNVSDLRTPFEHTIYDQLLSGTLGYRLTRRFRWTSPWDTLNTRGVLTTLDLVNPHLAVFQLEKTVPGRSRGAPPGEL